MSIIGIGGTIGANLGGFTQEHVLSPYDKFLTEISYETSQGELQIPIAGVPSPLNTPTSEVVTTSLPYDVKVVRFFVQRIGLPPDIPSPATSDPNETLLSSRIIPYAPALQPDGTNKLFSIAGEYRYALRVPVDLSKGLKMGKVAYAQAPSTENILPADRIRRDLI